MYAPTISLCHNVLIGKSTHVHVSKRVVPATKDCAQTGSLMIHRFVSCGRGTGGGEVGDDQCPPAGAPPFVRHALLECGRNLGRDGVWTCRRGVHKREFVRLVLESSGYVAKSAR
jgi:hypothetical protein